MSLTLQQIVDMADNRVPNAETDATKVEYLDQLQRTLYSKFRFPQEMVKESTAADTAFYELPDYVEPGRILKVVLTDSTGKNPQEYARKELFEQPTYFTYTIFETGETNMIGFYPEPSETGRLIFITYEQGPNTLSSTDMTTVPRFFKKYHMLFTYGLAAELAKIQLDIGLADNYDRDFNSLLREAVKEINYPQPVKTQDVMKRYRRYGRRSNVEVIVQGG